MYSPSYHLRHRGRLAPAFPPAGPQAATPSAGKPVHPGPPAGSPRAARTNTNAGCAQPLSRFISSARKPLMSMQFKRDMYVYAWCECGWLDSTCSLYVSKPGLRLFEAARPISRTANSSGSPLRAVHARFQTGACFNKSPWVGCVGLEGAAASRICSKVAISSSLVVGASAPLGPQGAVMGGGTTSTTLSTRPFAMAAV